MNKTDFLKELKNHLIVLENNEQQDILDEYSQHIDMKIERGLSEEEAISDFGSISELAAQILEAYHVNPEYDRAGEEKKKKLPDLTTFANTGKKAGGSIGHTLCKFGRLLRNSAVRCWNIGILFFRRICSVITKPLHWAAERIRERRRMRAEDEYSINNSLETTGSETEDLQSDANKSGIYGRRKSTAPIQTTAHRPRPAGVPSMAGRLIHSIRRFLSSCFSLTWKLFCWGIRWCWNGAVIFISLFSGAAALFSIFSFAAMLVWLAQGYPIAGITVLCLGSILSSVSFTVLCLSLLKLNHPRKAASPVVLEMPEEEDHA